MIDLTVKNVLKLTVLFVCVLVLANLALWVIDKSVKKLFGGCGCQAGKAPCGCNGAVSKKRTPKVSVIAKDLATDEDDSDSGTTAGQPLNFLSPL